MRSGQEYVPNISHVFRTDQHLYLFYEIYNPARAKSAESAPKSARSEVRVLSSLELLQGTTKVWETPLVEAKTLNAEDREAVAMELDLPLSALKPGQYIGQLNVIDDAAGSFSFPRFAILVKEAPSALPPSAVAPVPVVH